jgi:hypothetical protein
LSILYNNLWQKKTLEKLQWKELRYFFRPRTLNSFNRTQALISLAFLITFVSVWICVHVFLIMLMLVNSLCLIIVKLLNSCNALHICK